MVAKNIGLIFKYFKLNMQKEYQYKTSFYTQILMMMLNNAFFILQWIIVFEVTDSIGGYGFKEVMLLWGLAAGSYGVAHVFFQGAFTLGDKIYEGKLDVYLTQPKNILLNISCSESSAHALGDILYTFVAFALAGASWWWYLASIPVIILGGIMYVAVVTCFQTLSFYIKRGSSVADMISTSYTLFANYPPVIFNTFTKAILYTIIPCGFATFAPAEHIFLGFNIWWILGIVGFTIITTILAFVLFKIGLKKYNSGNLMGGRV